MARIASKLDRLQVQDRARFEKEWNGSRVLLQTSGCVDILKERPRELCSVQNRGS